MSNKDPPEVSERSHLKVFLPRKLVECLPKCPVLPKEQLRWNTNEEIASYLITFEKHDEWLSCSPKTRPQNGSVILYNRKKVKYRKDGYCWKKRKDGKTTREDHMKLKVQGVECLYGCYVHSSIVPTFHRRCYWLLQNPDIVLVHYLNVPAMEECGRPCAPPLCSPPLCTPPICAATADPREWLKWSQEELVAQLRPMFHGVKWGCGNGGAPPGLSLEQLVQHVLERHQARPPPRTHACLCAGGLGTPGHKCGSTKHRIISPKVERGGGGGVPGDAPKPAPSSPDTTQPSPGLGGGAAAPEGPRGGPAFPLPLLVVSSLGGGAAPGGPEQPLGLTPSQHLVTPEGTCPTAPPPPAAFDPDCFLNSPRRGQTYGCEAEAPPGAPPPPPAVPPKPGGGQEEEEEGKPGVVLQDPPCELNVAPPQHPFPLPFPELLGGDAGVPPNPRGVPPDPHEPPPTPHPPPSPPAPLTDPPVAITDFSPEWSYPEGGVKVLITGPWGDPGAYSCLFDRTSVPAALVQPGVLRCYCPPHEAGVAALRVACPPRLLTAAAPFEYRARGAVRGPPGTQMDWLALDETQFRLSILERLEQLETRLGALPPPAPLLSPRGAPSDPPPEQGPGSSFEARVVAVCEAMMARPGWPGPSPGPSALAHGATFRGMTLLHLAAAQGYAGLVEALRRWRAQAVDSLELEQEIDPLNVDHFSCTPLMWACALGHREAAERLCRWDRRALAVPDTLGRLPLALARARGHLALVTRLEELQMSPVSPRCHLPGLRVPSPLSASPDTGLSTASSLSSPSGLSEGPSSVPLPPGPPGPPEDESWGVAVPPSPPEDALAAPTDILQAEVVTLARQIIEATPERIKQEAPGGPPGALGALGAAGGPAGGPAGTPGTPGGLSAAMAWLATYLESVDRPPAPPHRAEAAPRGSPGVPERPPPPSAVGWAEFLNASGGARGEGGAVALLTLSDQEQHELYEAARLVQGAFRKYRGRRLKEQQELAAAVIQRCYRKYKQFALFQRMTQAAILIQSKFRSYAEQKRFQRRRRAAVLIQQRFRSLRQHRSTFLTLKQDQAARKIMRFLRRCRHRMEELKQNKEVDSLQTRGLAS
ncbi:calmodulin-binding transcription activator 2 isoform X2 [Pipra filicauda]|uniref:Calmodulin-binding transcription activator 2 isoform X2 n=1 Tax=Pipra filicauda TaxID=649802 RepID=A0A6J2FZ59_9PASS|nr:calmodulin-binding transcription activator 2 isoform X2 [Pipra filicauda]